MSAKKTILSGSTDGKLIKVAATSTAGTTIHTAEASNKDEVHLYAYNNHTSDVKLTIEFGGATVPDDLIEETIPFKNGLHLVLPGLVISGSLVVKAFAATTNVIYIAGYVNEIGGTDQTLSKEFFSGSTNGRGVEATATSSVGTTIHTAHASELDEIYMWGVNHTTSNEEITIEWGGTGSDHQIKQTLTGENGLELMVPGLVLTNSGTVKVFAATASSTHFGYVNRYTT